MANLILIPLILVVGYLLLIRPQQQRVRRQQELMSSISVGDQVVTAGGIVATVTAIDEERAWLEIAPGVTVEFLRQAISRRLEPPTEEEDEDGQGGGVFGRGPQPTPPDDESDGGEAQANAG